MRGMFWGGILIGGGLIALNEFFPLQSPAQDDGSSTTLTIDGATGKQQAGTDDGSRPTTDLDERTAALERFGVVADGGDAAVQAGAPRTVLIVGRGAAGAEAVYRRDLEVYPRNGWSMFGLVQALEAQGKDAAEMRARFETTWQQADVTLTSSTF